MKRDKGPICDGSGAFPTSFDGEFTKCETCCRKLNLDRDGKVPSHRVNEPKNYTPASRALAMTYLPSQRAIDARTGSWPDE